jgi:hypothetical protein
LAILHIMVDVTANNSRADNVSSTGALHGNHSLQHGQHAWAQQYPPANPQAALVVYLVMFTLMGAQLGIAWWQRSHRRSYDMVRCALELLSVRIRGA